MSAGEIATANLGLSGDAAAVRTRPRPARRARHIVVEGPRGELRVSGVVTDPQTERDVRSGQTRGLARDERDHGRGGQRIHAQTDELSLCAELRRGGCYVTELEGIRTAPQPCQTAR